MNGITQSRSYASSYQLSGVQDSIAPIGLTTDCSIDEPPVSVNQCPVDFSLAEEPLAMNRFHRVKTNELNQKIKSTIVKALTSPECDPAVKRRIFENIMNVEKNIQHDSGKHDGASVDQHYLEVINGLLDEIRESGKRIILDNTDFTAVNLKNLDLTGASAISAKFVSMRMDHVIWQNGELVNARFVSMRICNCYFDQTSFAASVFSKCFFENSMINKSTLLKTRFYEASFDHVFMLSLENDDVQLRKKISQAELRDRATMWPDSPKVDESCREFDQRIRRMALNCATKVFAKVLSFKHTSYDSTAGSISILRTSLAIREAVPAFPVCIAELAGQYASEDSLWAQLPLQTNFGNVVSNERNQTIKSAIKSALVSSECDPKIKATIFRNMMNFRKRLETLVTGTSYLSEREQLGENSYIRAINEILAEIREDRNQIILDMVDFTGLNLRLLNLSGASAVSAKFNSMEMAYVVWTGGNFSLSLFKNANIRRCRFKESIFNRTVHSKTNFQLSELTNTQMFGVEFQSTIFDGVFVNRLKTDDPVLQKIIAEHRISICSLRQTYSSEFLDRSVSAPLIIQYAGEESTDFVNFLACEFSTRRQVLRATSKP